MPEQPRVAVVGSVNVDLALTVPRLPAPGETVAGGTLAVGLGGKGANAAVAAARLGATAALVACVGDDDHAALARAALAAAGVELAGLTAVAGPTGVAVVLTEPAGENAIALAPGANAALTAAHVATALPPLRARVIVANLEVPDAAVLAAARAARGAGAVFVLDPAPARALPDALLALTDVLLPNAGELDALDPSGGRALLAAGAGAIVRTDGPRGATILRAGRPPVAVPAFPVRARDTTGAGDAFCAALAVALAAGEPLDPAARRGAAAGALATRAAGAQASLPSAADVAALLT